jgi:alpha-beta hydrolase superfamily lysophospholipase
MPPVTVLATTVQAADGTALHVRRWAPPEPAARKGAVLIVHGLGEHSGRYERVAELLTGLGLEVRAYDQRGHGQSGGPRGGIPHPDALLEDLRQVFSDLEEDARGAGDTEPPFLLGHSMGGTIAARAATGGWVVPRGLILSSPLLLVTVSRTQRLMAAVGRRLAPDRAVANGLDRDGLSHDPAVVAAYVADEQVHDRITPRLFEFLNDASDHARRDARTFTVPTLLLVSGSDRLVDAAGSRAFADALPAGTGTLHGYDDLYHELFNEPPPDRERVLADLSTWIRARL